MSYSIKDLRELTHFYKTQIKFYFPFIITLFFFSCKKNNDGNNPSPPPPPPPPTPTVVLKTADSVITVDEKVPGLKEAERLAQNMPASDFYTTGFYLPPNKTLQIEVTQLSGNHLPVLLVGTYSRYKSKWNPSTIYLSAGINSVSDATGGILYVRYTNDNPNGSCRLKFISGMLPIPYYQLGKTTQDDWVKMVDNIKNVPDVQLVGTKTIITFSMSNAKNYKNENQEALIKKADRIIAIEDSISGLTGSDPTDQPNIYKYLMAESDDPDYYMAATYYRTWYRNPDAVTAILKGDNLTWGPWHELGHMHQQGSWTWSEVMEVTVNIYSIAVEKAFGQSPTRLTSQGEWNNAATYLARPDAERDFNGSNASVWIRLCMFQQLKLAFGENFYHELHRQGRRETNRPSTTDEKMRWFMLKSCSISGKSLTDFFKKWGMKLSNQSATDAVYAEIAALSLPAPSQDLTLLKD